MIDQGKEESEQEEEESVIIFYCPFFERSILELLNKGVFNKILTVIKDLVCDLNVSQDCSLQLLFDVQYVALVLAPPGWKDEWVSVSFSSSYPS